MTAVGCGLIWLSASLLLAPRQMLRRVRSIDDLESAVPILGRRDQRQGQQRDAARRALEETLLLGQGPALRAEEPDWPMRVPTPPLPPGYGGRDYPGMRPGPAGRPMPGHMQPANEASPGMRPRPARRVLPGQPPALPAADEVMRGSRGRGPNPPATVEPRPVGVAPGSRREGRARHRAGRGKAAL